MRICIGGKNNIAVDVCGYILEYYPDTELSVIPNKGDDGIDRSQRSLKKYAQEHNVPIVSLTEVYPWDDLIFLSVEFDRIIRPEKFASKQLFNIHFSLLPKYKGCHTAAMPILNGDEIGGVTFHLMDAGIDTGDIIDQEKVLICKDETCRSLYHKYLELGAKVVKRNLEFVINKTYKTCPQPSGGSTYYPRTDIDYSNLQIDYNRTAIQIERQIRAYSFRDFQLPQFDGQPISFVEITGLKSKEKPGTIVSCDEHTYTLATIDYDIILHRDRFLELMDMVDKGELDKLRKVDDLGRYVKEQEPLHGWTLLMVAAYHNYYEVAKYLIKKGSDINACNYKGTTVIMYAKDGMLQTEDDRLFSSLLSLGANPYMQDYTGKDLFDYIDNKLKYKMIMNIPFKECKEISFARPGGGNLESIVKDSKFKSWHGVAFMDRRVAA